MSSMESIGKIAFLKSYFLRLLCVPLWTLFLAGCGGGGGGGDSQANSTPVYPEPDYCSTVQSHSPSTSVTGTAVFYYRPLGNAGGGVQGLVGDPTTDTIAAAEVVVTNSGGTVVQCSFVDSSGNISVSLPRTAGTYTVTVKSRANNALLKASILSDITNNQPYTVSRQVTLDGISSTATLGQVTAYARQSESTAIEGAAFNILKNLSRANLYVRTQIADSSWVADKVTVYWKAGFNPYTYFGGTSSLSFYRPSERKLYILGGKNDNVKTADTDHFDNSVILHEYGHFLEDVYGKTDSPGGSHNGNRIIDPRLAWSEGWANFFQAAVQGTSAYIDTIGFCQDTVETSGTACNTGINLPLGESGASATMDAVGTNGEGTFREVSISRALFKTIRTPASTSVGSLGAAIPFSAVWNIFSNGTSSPTLPGLHSSTIHFRNSGKFFSLLNSVVAANHSGNVTEWNAIMSNERQPTNTKYYADTLTQTGLGSCAKYPMTLSPLADIVDIQGNRYSNKFRSNHFYEYYYNGSSNATISFTYTQTGNPTNLDLVVYKEDHYYYEEQSEALGVINNTYATRSVRSLALDGGGESVSMSGQPAGYYLINVKAATYMKLLSELSPVNYTLKETISGTERLLCPDN